MSRITMMLERLKGIHHKKKKFQSPLNYPLLAPRRLFLYSLELASYQTGGAITHVSFCC